MKNRFAVVPLALVAAHALACSGNAPQPDEAQTAVETPPAAIRGPETLKLAQDVKWEALNPARGEASPRAGTLWGDRQANVATGFLVTFADGFSSPPHIHNVTYRGVVISGLVHNDDAEAEPMWMKPGSFWTQPQGASHITASQGVSTAYIEIDAGPYLVRPPEQATPTDEFPVNVDVSNVVWLGASDFDWGFSDDTVQAEVAYLWGEPNGAQPFGLFVRVPGESSVQFQPTERFRGVVVAGAAAFPEQKNSAPAGSYFSSSATTSLTCSGAPSCVFYVRTSGDFSVRPR